jgi:hypothetical protein
MRSLRSSVPADLFRIFENNEFWRDPRAKSLSARSSKLPLKNIENRALYVRVVANALIGLPAALRNSMSKEVRSVLLPIASVHQDCDKKSRTSAVGPYLCST